MDKYLFRGKRASDGAWLYGDLFHTRRRNVVECCIHSNKYCFQVDKTTVGQYTGLKDKNGKRIFEGDICQIKNHRLIDDTPFVVEWEDFAYNGWTWRDIDEVGAVDSFTTGAARNCEVIGNIHDNPELLEVLK